ncbi:AMP-binding protein [Labedella endophytica]|uniref:O-succinylbenzoate--CoA ligase n=1 Tax=Labedella endophytica TaxID=1523160 RepID=A0A3S1CUD2_9MICO|nr:AMP-binding protein [Labedella endophytica]RUR03357.1 hypothetical protein ELQ94_02065 [Labedella endophytica]
MRPLVRVDSADPLRLRDALASALDGTGPAVQPVDEGAAPLSVSSLSPLGEAGIEEVPDDVAVVLATSGSSGYPKRVALSSSALLASAGATEAALGGPGRWVLAMPAHYVAGVQVLVRSIVAGTDPVPLSGGRFSADAFVDAARTARDGGIRSYSALVPAQVSRLLEHSAGRSAMASIDAVIVGGQAVPMSLRERAAEAGVRLIRTYGSSETAGGCVYDGRSLDGVDVRIVGGQIEIGGATLAAGYLDDAERTATAFHEVDGRRWFRTGDAGTMRDGVLEVLGRLDNVVVSGGVNVSLDRVESVVRDRAGFGEAVVVGVPDDRWGAVPVVVVGGTSDRGDDARTTATTAFDALRAAVAEQLGVAARPARLVVLDALPLLATGKPDRRAIADFATSRTGAERRPADG